jgi:hypothetical protein
MGFREENATNFELKRSSEKEKFKCTSLARIIFTIVTSRVEIVGTGNRSLPGLLS